MLHCPGFETIPITAFMFEPEIGKWDEVPLRPDISTDGNIAVAHCRLADPFKTFAEMLDVGRVVCHVVVGPECELAHKIDAVQCVICFQLNYHTARDVVESHGLFFC